MDGTLNRGSRRGPPRENSLSYGLPTRPSHPERLTLRLREGTHAYVTSHRANVGSAHSVLVSEAQGGLTIVVTQQKVLGDLYKINFLAVV